MTAHRLCAFDDLIDGGVRRFDADGHAIAVVRLPATQPVPVYEVAVVDGDVMVEVGR